MIIICPINEILEQWRSRSFQNHRKPVADLVLDEARHDNQWFTDMLSAESSESVSALACLVDGFVARCGSSAP